MPLNEYALIKKIGHISKTSKMPCYSWSRSAFNCNYTDPLCIKLCYAKRHHYNYSNVKDALAKNEEIYYSEDWVKNFTMFLKDFVDAKYFRWFDSGDLQGDLILMGKIGQIADQCPDIKFWMPTRDKEILKQYKRKVRMKLNKRHPNLIIRLSADNVDTDPNYKLADQLGVLVSSVKSAIAMCKAKENGGQCGSCRVCWSDKVKEVSYYLH